MWPLVLFYVFMVSCISQHVWQTDDLCQHVVTSAAISFITEFQQKKNQISAPVNVVIDAKYWKNFFKQLVLPEIQPQWRTSNIFVDKYLQTADTARNPPTCSTDKRLKPRCHKGAWGAMDQYVSTVLNPISDTVNSASLEEVVGVPGLFQSQEQIW